MYNGYLVKIKGIEGSELHYWDYTIPNSAIIWESYKATYSTLDGDSKRNSAGRLKRKTYKHRVAHCSFTFKSMTNTEFFNIWELIKARFVKQRQKKVKASIWVPEINAYVEDYFYIPDIEFTVRKVEDSIVKYTETEIELIGY